jgi:hypothetical protein
VLICKEIAIKNLILLKEILNKHHCAWWLSDGTLLGAVREQDFISHDTDTDIGVSWSTFSKECFLEIVQVFKLVNVYGYVDDCLELTIERAGTKTDIFLFYEKNGTEIYHSAFAEFKRNKIWRVSKLINFFQGSENNFESVNSFNLKCAGYKRIDYVYEKFSLSTINFLGEKFNCPLIPEKYLECKYGQDWGTPKKQWDYAYSPLNHLRTNIYIDQKIVKGKFLKWLKF